jgi:spore coat protein A
MAGLYLPRDEHEPALNLPSGAYDIPLLIQDRSFYDNGQIYYPTGPHDLGNHANVEVTPTSHASDFAQPTVVPHFVGNTNLVNGVVWPYLEVEPRKYRFRIVNGANSRHYDLSLVGPDDQQVIFHQIGTDGGLLAHPVDRTRVLLAPADRADVVVDFSTFSIDQELLLRNLAPDGFSLHHAAQPADPSTTGQVIRLRVVPAKGPDDSSLPSRLINIRRLKESNAVRSRRFELVEAIDHHGRPVMLLDGKHWSDPVSAIARLGETEIWEIENFTAFPHPIHLHATQFQLLDRVNRQTGPVELAEYELGWEDTVTVNPRERVRIIVPFEQFSGTFVWHCHMLEHEDHEMMRPFQVVAPEPNSLQLLLLSTALARVAGPFRFRRRVGASAKRGE